MDHKKMLTSPYSYVTGIRKSALFDHIAQLAKSEKRVTPFVPKSFINPATLTKYPTNVHWDALEIDVRQRASKDIPSTTNYGPLLDSCKTHPQEKMLNHPFTGKNLVVMSNGACGSSCAIVAAFLQEVANTTSVYAASEFHNNATNVPLYSFAGGQVLNSDQIYQFLKRSKHPDAPQPFPTNATLSFTFRSIYSQKSNDSLPLEFIGLRATWIIPITTRNALQMDRLWESACEAVGFFDVNQENIMCRALYEFTQTVEKHNYLSKMSGVRGADGLTAQDHAFVSKTIVQARHKRLGNRTIAEARAICENWGELRLGTSLTTTSFEDKEKWGEIISKGDAIDEFYDRR
jgi:hypothetical protein